ncbi:unnamed protein product [Lactuca virosa]|uniref:SWIM-type domain-containing protein n=1 Tax=Lactuca virosa TaxID=75947 RepID=A0AAU9MEJ3_9ASTR|nr:unnamed protein product [Lactuca virosa]
MAESSRRRKSKELKTTKKTRIRYVRDEESNDDLLDLGLLDVEEDNFNPTSNLCDDPFLNILCDDKMLKNNQFERDDEVDVEDIHQVEHEHEHLEDENDLEVGVEFRVHDPLVKWNKMKPTVDELYESPAQLRFYYLADIASTWTTESCPAIIEKMEEFGKEIRNWKVIDTGGYVFETRYVYATYKVDLEQKYYTCRLWEISGIPCVHG